MGRGARTWRIPAQRRQRESIRLRFLATKLAMGANKLRPTRREKIVNRSIPGNGLIKIILRYLAETGATGTAGEATNLGQALGGLPDAAQQITKPAQPSGGDQPKIDKKTGMTDAWAVVVKMPSFIYEDILKANALMCIWDKISFEWESSLLKGSYNLFKCVDYGQTTTKGDYYLVVGISTNSFYLQKFKNDILGTDLKISYWKTIQGRAPWPETPKGAPPPPKHPTFKQG